MSTAAISLPRLARHNPLAAIGILFVVGFIFCALFAPWIAPQDPAHIDLPNRLQTPSSQHIAGTDELGRDILSRLIWGARISMFVGSCVVVCSLALGLHHRRHCRILRRPHRSLREHRCDECVSLFPRNSDRHCLCRLPRTGNI